MTRVLAISNMYPPHYYGGYELSCRDVMERLAARGHETSVLTTTMRVPGVQDPPGERQAGVWRDLEFYWRDHELLSPPPWRRLAIERANQSALAEALERSRPEVVSVWNMGAMSLGLLTTLAERRIPCVYAVCDDWLDYGRRLDAWTRMFTGRPRLAGLVRRVTGVPTGPPADLGSTGAFCFVSDCARGRAEMYSPWRYAISTVVYSGIDRRDFPPPTGAAEERPWRWRLIYVGRIDPRKGVETAVRALALLPAEATLEVVGGGDAVELDRLKDLAGALGVADRVSFDVATRAELAARYRAADVFVFPSTWDEPFGLVPVEAMACDTPVVATARGGAAEFLLDGANCLVFPAGDDAALAAAVTRLAADGSLRLRLVAGGRVLADELTVDRLADVFERWHVAAARRFADGVPEDRPPLGARRPGADRPPEGVDAER